MKGKAGRYVLESPLGRGTAGEVWRAKDPDIGRLVAVKIMCVPEGLPSEESREWRERFLREARAAGRLSHPGIVPIYDVGKADDGRPFLVMELIEGRSVDAVAKEGPRPAAETVLEWGAQVAEALDAAHRSGIVHRDIKPANIMIDVQGRARIADFGIARLSESDLTRTGLFLGSPAFASPEQLKGDRVDARSDLFSLAATLYLLLTTVRPFRGEDLAGLTYAICHQDPDPPGRLAAGLGPACDRVVLKALSKDPSRRYRSGREMAADLRAAAAVAAEATLREAAPAASPAPFGRHVAAAARAPVPLVKSLARTTASAVARGGAAAGRLWMMGWRSGPRARAAMIVGAIVLLAAIGWGSAVVSQRIEERRETPGQKFKKAFRSLVPR